LPTKPAIASPPYRHELSLPGLRRKRLKRYLHLAF
jgi:hypothetical protein